MKGRANEITGANSRPLGSSSVADFGGALWWSRVTGVITAGRLSLSSVVRPFMRPRPIIIAAVMILATVAVGAVALRRAKQRAGFIGCGNYLVSIGCAARLWASDHGGEHFPPDLLSMSNEVATPKIYVCPGDHSRQPAANCATFTPEQSSFEVVTPSLRVGDTNQVFLRCKVHGSVLYGDGSVFVHGQRHHKY